MSPDNASGLRGSVRLRFVSEVIHSNACLDSFSGGDRSGDPASVRRVEGIFSVFLRDVVSFILTARSGLAEVLVIAK